MIFSEGLMLSGIGIPAGILIGIVSAYFIRPGGLYWGRTFPDSMYVSRLWGAHCTLFCE
ncbi:MAG: hypothetical protein ACLRJA_24105 [Blautia producta]